MRRCGRGPTCTAALAGSHRRCMHGNTACFIAGERPLSRLASITSLRALPKSPDRLSSWPSRAALVWRLAKMTEGSSIVPEALGKVRARAFARSSPCLRAQALFDNSGLHIIQLKSSIGGLHLRLLLQPCAPQCRRCRSRRCPSALPHPALLLLITGRVPRRRADGAA